MRASIILAGTLLLAGAILPARTAAQTEPAAGHPAHTLDAGAVAALQTFLAGATRTLGVPGAAVALVQDDRVLFEGGLGVRRLDRPESIDAHTLFMLGPVTSALTGLLAAKAVDQGRLDWATPLAQIYGGSAPGADAAIGRLRIGDLLNGCAGLPDTELPRTFNTLPGTPAASAFTRLGRPSAAAAAEPCRFDALAGAAAGYAAAHLFRPRLELGDAYDTAMRREILAPLGLDETALDMAAALAADHASPHGDDLDGRPAAADLAVDYALVPYRPAAGGWSSAHDLAGLLRFELGDGQDPAGGRLMSAAAVQALRRPIATSSSGTGFAPGLRSERIDGVDVLSSSGRIAGYSAAIFLLPDARAGAAVLTNADNGQVLLRPLLKRLIELLFDRPQSAAGELAAAADALREAQARAHTGLVFPVAADAAASLADRYVSAELGQIDVRREGAQVVFDFGAWRSLVASRRDEHGAIAFVTVSPGVAGYEFRLEGPGARGAILLAGEGRAYRYTAQ